MGERKGRVRARFLLWTKGQRGEMDSLRGGEIKGSPSKGKLLGRRGALFSQGRAPKAGFWWRVWVGLNISPQHQVKCPSPLPHRSPWSSQPGNPGDRARHASPTELSVSGTNPSSEPPNAQGSRMCSQFCAQPDLWPHGLLSRGGGGGGILSYRSLPREGPDEMTTLGTFCLGHLPIWVLSFLDLGQEEGQEHPSR